MVHTAHLTLPELSLRSRPFPLKKSGTNSKWNLSFVFSVEKADYRIDSDIPAVTGMIRGEEEQELSYSTGLELDRWFGNHLGIEVGFLYQHTAIALDPKKIFALPEPGGRFGYKYVTSSGFVYLDPANNISPSFGDSILTTDGKHTLDYLSLPILARYKTIGKKIEIIPGAGIAANFLLNAEIETEIKDPQGREKTVRKRLEGINHLYFSLLAETEIRYRINSKWSASIRPAFKYAITPITKENIVETYPYSVGIGAGLVYKF